MKRLCLGLIASLLIVSASVAADKPPTLSDKLQDTSVTIRAANSEGSGSSFCRDGYSFVWTAGHVVDGLRRTRSVIVGGKSQTIVEFDDAKVVKVLIEEGRTVGRIEINARVIKYSDAEYGEDLAILLVRKKGFLTGSVDFSLTDELIPLGERLLHCGSLLGEMGSNSLTSGIMSQHGRVIRKKVYDQATVVAFPGSSGGAVVSAKTGKYVGMLVRGTRIQGFNLMVPTRRIVRWCRDEGIMWAIDKKSPLPKDITKVRIEDKRLSPGNEPVGKSVIKKSFPFLIKEIPGHVKMHVPTLPRRVEVVQP